MLFAEAEQSYRRRGSVARLRSPQLPIHEPKKESRIMLITQLRTLWTGEEGQDIAEYAVMLAVILVLVVGTIRLVGSNANNAFSSVASSLQ
jgi:Flp pilus assembly pilin Flp